MSETERGGVPDLAPAIRDEEFVSRIGSVLMLAGKPFRFHGNNIYFNQADIVYGRMAAVEETLDRSVALAKSRNMRQGRPGSHGWLGYLSRALKTADEAGLREYHGLELRFFSGAFRSLCSGGR